VLLVSTGNFIVTFFAVLSIMLVLGVVLGVIGSVLAGWQLDVTMVVAGIVAVGFSVDYLLHLGHVLVEAQESGFLIRRDERLEYAF